MSSTNSPSRHSYQEDAFVHDADFKVDINHRMKVPEKIMYNNDPPRNGDVRSSWVRDNFNMQVPERILVIGQDKHIGTRAPPREIAFDNSLLGSTESHTVDLPRVATPPRSLTLDKYPFPGIDNYKTVSTSSESEYEPEQDKLPVVKPKKSQKVNPQLNESVYSNYRDGTPPLGLSTGEEIVHLRRQLAKLNRRVMALELDSFNRLQKEKIVAGLGVAYFLFKIVLWMNRD